MTRASISRQVVERFHTEALLLADEARSYFGGHGRGERDTLPPVDRVALACEALRVTTRLMHVIAWLLFQRAVAAGEISADQAAAAERRLGAEQPADEALLPRLPAEARRLVAATVDLHRRVARLDATLGAAPSLNPVGGLLARLAEAF